MLPVGTFLEHCDQLPRFPARELVLEHCGQCGGLVAARQPPYLPADRHSDKSQADVFDDLLMESFYQGDPAADPTLVPAQQESDLGLLHHVLPEKALDDEALFQGAQASARTIQFHDGGLQATRTCFKNRCLEFGQVQ